MKSLRTIILLSLLTPWLFSTARGQLADPLPDIPLGEIRIQPSVFAAGFTPEEVQENPVGFTQIVGPTDLTPLPSGQGHLVVANYGGTFAVLDTTGNELADPLVDLSDPASPSYSADFEFGQAHGVTAIAFHPAFADPTAAGFKKFYTLETETALSGEPDFGGSRFPSIRDGAHHDNVLYEYTLGSVSDLSCGANCEKRELLRVLQPGWHHNLGDLAFDDDQLLLISSGDGSTAGTTPPIMSDNSLVLTNVYGKVLRIDPLGTDSENGRYGVPDNPFADGPGGQVDEIYAYGLRNPFRLAHDSVTGDFYLSETGENTVESADRLVAGGNYGWNLKEGSFLYDPTTREVALDIDSDQDGLGDVAEANGLIDPVFEYDRDDGRSIVGGALYRGERIPALQGHYVFADFDGRLFYGDPETGVEYEFRIDGPKLLPSKIHSINVDASGELYVLGVRQLSDGSYDGWVVSLGRSGDFNDDGQLAVTDIDLLAAATRTVQPDRRFDLTEDGAVDTEDMRLWVHQLRQTWFGDANLDGEFNSADLVDVFVAGEYEDSVAANSTWETGDWNGDAEFTSADLVLTFQDGGYEQGQRRVVASVPEPAAGVLSGIALLAVGAVARRRRGIGS